MKWANPIPPFWWRRLSWYAPGRGKILDVLSWRVIDLATLGGVV